MSTAKDAMLFALTRLLELKAQVHKPCLA